MTGMRLQKVVIGTSMVLLVIVTLCVFALKETPAVIKPLKYLLVFSWFVFFIGIYKLLGKRR